MRNQLKYFLWNKVQDYSRGFLENLTCDRNGIFIPEPKSGSSGVFLSGIMDSQEKDMEWHRLTFTVSPGSSIPYKITIFAANQIDDLEVLIHSPGHSVEEKLKRMEPFIQKQESGISDMLLFGVVGRYLWIAIELFGQSGPPVKLGQMKFYFPRQTWLDYLPEVYQANDPERFLERYLAIFQTLHEELNQKIWKIPDMIDVDGAKAEDLIGLCEWLDIAGSYMWSEKQLRQLLKNGVRLYKKRGTRAGMLELIRLYTEGEAYLVEFHQVEPYLTRQADKEYLTGLYGNNPYTFTIILQKDTVLTQKEYRSLLRVIDEVKPAQMDVNLVVLEPYIILGGHVYLGINSAFGEYRDLTLDGLSMLPFTMLSSAANANR